MNVRTHRHILRSRLCMVLASATLAATTALAGPTLAFAAAGPTAPAPPGQSESFPTIDRRAMRAAPSEFAPLASRAASDGQVRALVGLQIAFTPEGALSPGAVRAQRAAIAAAGTALTQAIAGSGATVVKTFEAVPDMVVVLPPAAVDALRRSRQAAYVRLDEVMTPSLLESIPLIEASEAHAVGRSGEGQSVAVLDTGVQASHYFMHGLPPCGGSGPCSSGPTITRVVAGACFSATSNCPNGLTASTSPGAGEPCTFTGCDHGTHVAGIAAGADNRIVAVDPNGTPPPPTPQTGVAPAANIIPVQIASKVPCVPLGPPVCLGFYTSDIVAGLSYVYGLTSPKAIAAVNMSLGGGLFGGTCDAVSPSLTNMIATLRSVKVATVVSSGNDGSQGAISMPSCISFAVAVGATSKTDVVASFSNSSPQVALLAPGVSITSSVPGGGFGVKSGTSMAAPHVAGTWALMKAVDPNASVSSILWDLQTTGKPVTGSNGLTRPRIRVLAASTMLSDTGFNSGAVFTGPGVDVASGGIGLAATGSGSLPVAVPGTATIRAAYLYWMTSGGPDNSATFQGSTVSGTLVGASRPCPGGLATPFRLYRAVVTTAVTPGTKTYAVSGIGGGVVVGQGASLVVVHGTPGAPVGRVAIRQGALTVFSGTGAKSQTFPNLLVPSSPTQAGLHVGMAGGSAGATQAPLTLSSLDVGTTNYAQGSGGPKWDNVQTPLTPAQITATLPVGTTTLVNSMPDAMSGCLAWGYSALSYR